jgi:hypothetical protein
MHFRTPILLFFLGFVIGTFPLPIFGQATCTHYASPSGGGNGLSQSSPFQIQNFWQVAGPGKTLCLLDGTYADSNSMIEVPLDKSGTSANPITIRALNEGKAIIDGQDSRRPLNGHGDWFVVEGIDFTRGDNANVTVHSDANDWIIRRFVSWNGGEGCDNNVSLRGRNGLVEDGALFGACRKQLFMGTGYTTGTTGNTARRIWSRWEDNTHVTSNPTNACEIGYGQDGVTFENVICTRKYIPSQFGRGSVTEAEGAGELFRTINSKWLGSIFYVPSDAGWVGGGLFSAFQDAGSGAPIKSAQNVVFKDLLGYLPSNYSSISNFRFVHSNYPAGSNNNVSNILGIGGTGNTLSTVSWTNGGNMNWYASLSQVPDHPFNLVPGVCKRYVNGVLTDQPLWPWPMNQRIIDALTRAGYTGTNVVDVTATIEQLFGQIPTICKTSATTPTPTPTVTPSQCSLLSTSSAIPVGFGSPFDVVNNPNQSMMNASCSTSNQSITLGNGNQTTYIYKTGYVLRNNTWQQVNYTGSSLLYSNWYVGNASGSLNLSQAELSQGTYFLSYQCQWIGNPPAGGWKCGCRTAACTGAEGNKFQIQYIKQ